MRPLNSGNLVKDLRLPDTEETAEEADGAAIGKAEKRVTATESSTAAMEAVRQGEVEGDGEK